MIKVKEYVVSARGERGLTITIPRLWAKDRKVKAGTLLEMYQDEEDRLIILPPKEDE